MHAAAPRLVYLGLRLIAEDDGPEAASSSPIESGPFAKPARKKQGSAHMTRIGIVAERGGETRVALTPPTVIRLLSLGYEVAVEAGAGAASAFPDAAYTDAGAEVTDRASAWGADIVVTVTAPAPDDVALLRDGATVIGMLAPAFRPEIRESLGTRGITAMSLDAVPRISRAQSMDV